VIDAVCPLVTKVHVQARRYADEGYTVVLIGHEGHEEVVGTMGEAPEATVLVQNVEEAEALQLPEGAKLAYVTQTTLSVDASRRSARRARRTSATRPPTGSGRSRRCFPRSTSCS
jgi:4-hydroxy-3-methylbut-2-enyl diphosphate reductase